MFYEVWERNICIAKFMHRTDAERFAADMREHYALHYEVKEVYCRR